MYILPQHLNKCSLYLRYIDDIFFIWKNSEAELKSFIKEINEIHPTIKFDVKYSYKEISFLDTTVRITSNNELVTILHKKPTDKQSFLHHKAYHPSSTKKSIPFSQALRLSRICSDKIDYFNQLEELKLKFTQRGYPATDIITQFKKASDIDRKETLKYKERTDTRRLVFSTTFNKKLPNIRQCFDENWPLLSINPVISKVFKEKPVVAYRRNDNLRKLIGQNKLSGDKKVVLRTHQKIGRCQPCRSKVGNLCCKQVKNTSTFSNRFTKKVYEIYHDLNCKSRNGIYLLECTKCENKSYVGKFETAGNERINNHR